MDDSLADDIGLFRRAMIPEFLTGMLRKMGDSEPNLLQMASLYVLDSGVSPTVGPSVWPSPQPDGTSSASSSRSAPKRNAR